MSEIEFLGAMRQWQARSARHTLSKAVEHDLEWVMTKIGFFSIVCRIIQAAWLSELSCKIRIVCLPFLLAWHARSSWIHPTAERMEA